MNIINANALSSNGRAALSRYGVVSDHNLHPTTSTTTVTVGNGNLGYISKIFNNSSQQSQHLAQQKYQQQQQQSYLNIVTKPHLLNTNLSTNDFSNNSIQQTTYISSIIEDGVYNNNSSNKSESTSPILTNFLTDTHLSTAVRSPSPVNRQQQKRRPRLGGGGYQLSHTQHPHVVL